MFGALAGVVLFFLVFDPRLVDPGYWIWLMEGDPATQYLGWRFFRAEPWHWPPGMIRSYGLEVGSAIVFTDSIPIAAFAAKLLSPFLPEPFQYFGLWALMCYALQGYFGGMLAALASERPVERYAITLLFVASLPVMDRAIGHFALMSHWLVLWGLWLALRPNRELSTGQWVAVTCIASLVHAYLLYIVLALWVADVLRRRHFDAEPRPSLGDWVRHVTIVAMALVATMALAGYFLLPTHAVTGGAQYYGKYATNLNAFWNPGWGSRFLPGLAVMKGAGLEGHAYLGLGMLVLLPIALLTLIAPGSARPNVKPYVPLIAVGFLLWMLAVSHLVAWGDRVVLEVPIRGKLLDTIHAARRDGADRRRGRASARGHLAALRRDARLLRRPLHRDPRETREPARLAVLAGGREALPDDSHGAGREHGARLGVALALRGRPRHGDQHRPVRAAVVPARRRGERRDHADAEGRAARSLDALPAVVARREIRLDDRPRRRRGRVRRLLRRRAGVVRGTARIDRSRVPRSRAEAGYRSLGVLRGP
jgi:hypothetical protein